VAGHPGPGLTCSGSGGDHRWTCATDVRDISRYLDAAATQSAPSPATLICWWSSGELLTPDVFIFSPELLMEKLGTMLAEALDNVPTVEQ